MTQTADSTLLVEDIETERIYCDGEFNCRGSIAPFEVSDLAKSIKDRGLQSPISVQPASDVQGGLPMNPRTGVPFDFRIVAGHRRYTAFRVLGQQDAKYLKIPCFVKSGLDDKNARIYNLIENFQRQDLNILQEAHALKHLADAGIARETVAKEIGMSGGWVQVRYYLLTLPEQIQQEAAAGIITQHQIKQLCSLSSPDEQFEAVRKIKEAKDRGESGINVGKKKKRPTTEKKPRKREEIFEMMELIAATAAGYGLHTRAMAWCAGQIPTCELFDDIKAADPDFVIPMEF